MIRPSSQWPFGEWGADVVLAGHDHLYERIHPPSSGAIHFVIGSGGAKLYDFGPAVEGSKYRYNLDYGAMLVDAREKFNGGMHLRFITRQGILLDEVRELSPQSSHLSQPILRHWSHSHFFPHLSHTPIVHRFS